MSCKVGVGVRAGLDYRGEGGYIIVAPSNHVSGGEYVWEDSSRPGKVQIAPWPGALLDLMRPTNGKLTENAAPIEDPYPRGTAERRPDQHSRIHEASWMYDRRD
jgi:hypothetical protein